MPAASDDAFWRASQLDSGRPLPHRVSTDRFLALVDEARAQVAAAPAPIRVQSMPTAEQVRGGVDPDALVVHEHAPHDSLVLFQVNHENGSASEEALRALIARSLSLS